VLIPLPDLMRKSITVARLSIRELDRRIWVLITSDTGEQFRYMGPVRRAPLVLLPQALLAVRDGVRLCIAYDAGRPGRIRSVVGVLPVCSGDSGPNCSCCPARNRGGP
jgi:hypothetical protein